MGRARAHTHTHTHIHTHAHTHTRIYRVLVRGLTKIKNEKSVGGVGNAFAQGLRGYASSWIAGARGVCVWGGGVVYLCVSVCVCVCLCVCKCVLEESLWEISSYQRDEKKKGFFCPLN